MLKTDCTVFVSAAVKSGFSTYRNEGSRQERERADRDRLHRSCLLLHLLADTSLKPIIPLRCRAERLMRTMRLDSNNRRLERTIWSAYQSDLILKSCLIRFGSQKLTSKYSSFKLQMILSAIPRSQTLRLLDCEVFLLLSNPFHGL